MATHFDDIPELADLDSGRNLIRVPVEQNVPFMLGAVARRYARVSAATPTSARAGGSSAKSTRATHTRFEHALGVYHNALRYLQQLRKDSRFSATVTRADAELADRDRPVA